jgi:diguanylate cyclase (GGDEF)-like protein
VVKVQMPIGSFKLRLVTYFVLLSLLPLLAAAWGFNEVAGRSELGNADARLNAALRVAVADYAETVERDGAETADSLARATSVQDAFATRNRAELVEIARAVPNTAFYSHGRLVAGDPPSGLGAERSERVVSASSRAELGRVVVFVPLDGAALQRLGRNAGLELPDRFVAAVGGRVVVGPPRLRGDRVVTTDRPRYVTLDDTDYRAVSTQVLDGGPSVSLVALRPRAEIEAAVGDLRERFLFFTFLALAVVAVLAYLLGRTIVRSLKELADAASSVARGQFERRVPVRGSDEFALLGKTFNDMAAQLASRRAELEAERGRVRDAVARFGEALAATHDPYALLPVIVESTVEATGASGGRLVVDGQEVARAGKPDEGGTPLVIPLSTDGGDDAVLLLSPIGSDFTDESRELAHWLGSQASVALENVRLHRIVERQAATDGLTELSNRRQFEEVMDVEIHRAERFGGSLALILADLDDFKQVNDRYGHATGDDVLRGFATVLRETARDIDLPARYGGEEFAILLPQTDVEGAERLAERLRRTIASRPMTTTPGAVVAVTASFGVAAFPQAPTAAALFAAADEALYRAKAAGKNCVMCAGPEGVTAA